MWCSVLHCDAAWCSYCRKRQSAVSSVLQCVAVCCSVLQCVLRDAVIAVCCSTGVYAESRHVCISQNRFASPTNESLLRMSKEPDTRQTSPNTFPKTLKTCKKSLKTWQKSPNHAKWALTNIQRAPIHSERALIHVKRVVTYSQTRRVVSKELYVFPKSLNISQRAPIHLQRALIHLKRVLIYRKRGDTCQSSCIYFQKAPIHLIRALEHVEGSHTRQRLCVCGVCIHVKICMYIHGVCTWIHTRLHESQMQCQGAVHQPIIYVW